MVRKWLESVLINYVLLLAWIGLNVADWATTKLSLAYGGTELNPLVNPHGSPLLMKIFWELALGLFLVNWNWTLPTSTANTLTGRSLLILCTFGMLIVVLWNSINLLLKGWVT